MAAPWFKSKRIDLAPEEREKLLAWKTGVGSDLPRHLAIIMDGNGRWAQARGLRRSEGHKVGAERMRYVVEAAGTLGLEHLTVYAFSTENWSRPYTEIQAIMKLFVYFFDKYIEELGEAGVRVRFLGEREGLPKEVQDVWTEADRSSRDRTGLSFNVAYNYGGRRELLRAAQGFARAAADQPELLTSDDEGLLRNFLYAPDIPDPELLIRTSGELRLSNFLLWQLAYTEFYTCPCYWPDFTVDDLLLALSSLRGRDRRFGGLSEADH